MTHIIAPHAIKTGSSIFENIDKPCRTRGRIGSAENQLHFLANAWLMNPSLVVFLFANPVQQFFKVKASKDNRYLS